MLAKPTAHHSYSLISSFWCWRSRGQCSPRPSSRIIGSPPWSSESLCISPFSSGSSKSGRVIPGGSLAAMLVDLLVGLGSDSGDLKTDAVDAGERGDVQRLAVGVAPGEVVRRFGQSQRPQMTAVRGDDPDAAGSARVD